ncbi:hypothetical protein ACQ86K_01205 [Mucilaginibacter sp. P19]|uniref:hypothetical protein n=1 Tax=Mucilaginibacter sp. P19 TaxID=3423947 RepID=UPI003D668736
MKSSIVPGYKDLFADQNESYSKLVSGISSEMVIRVMSALNNELNGTGGLQGNQAAIFADFTKRFTHEQRGDLKDRLNAFTEKLGEDSVVVFFGPRYFMTMILKELNSYRTSEENDDPAIEYQLFKAYLLIIDEVAEKDHQAIDFKSLIPGDPDNLLRIMWLPTINQFEYNEKCSQLFETYKSMCFFRFMVNSKYKHYLKEYLAALHFKSVGRYLKSFDQINKTVQHTDPNAAMLKRLNYIVPDDGVDQTHLQRLSVNLKEKDHFDLLDIKVAPLCYAADRKGYMVIDYNYSNKKIFKGAFFEICHTTSLTQNPDYDDKKRQKIFNTYSKDVSDEFEKQYFKPVMQLFSGDTNDLVYFDDGTPSCPDCYIRVGNKVILFEYKAYVFQDELIKNPDFAKLNAYLDKKFVQSENDQPKGVGQLVNQIELFIKQSFTFDKELYRLHEDGDIMIFPVIVYSDFNFSLPGVNNYLNYKMMRLLQEVKGQRLTIAPLVMINLETILDLAVTDKNMIDLGSGFLNYFEFLQQSQAFLAAQPTQNNFMRANMSFDEFYNAYLIEPTTDKTLVPKKMRELLILSGIDIDEFNKAL